MEVRSVSSWLSSNCVTARQCEASQCSRKANKQHSLKASLTFFFPLPLAFILRALLLVCVRPLDAEAKTGPAMVAVVLLAGWCVGSELVFQTFLFFVLRFVLFLDHIRHRQPRQHFQMSCNKHAHPCPQAIQSPVRGPQSVCARPRTFDVRSGNDTSLVAKPKPKPKPNHCQYNTQGQCKAGAWAT